MTQSTPNLNLTIYNNTTDLNRTFLQFLNDSVGITNSNMTKIDTWAGSVGGGSSEWNNVSATWNFNAGNRISSSNDFKEYLTVGTRIRLKQSSGTWKYFVVTNLGATGVFGITGGNLYSLLNETITEPQYSRFSNPIGYPYIYTWTPSVSVSGGTGVSISANSSRFWVEGSRLHFDIKFSLTISGGTPGNTIILESLPESPSSANIPVLCFVRDSSSGNIPYGIGSTEDGAIYLHKSDYSNFTTGSGKFISATGSFEMVQYEY